MTSQKTATKETTRFTTRPFSALRCTFVLRGAPTWQTCLTPFEQLYVLLFLPMKMRCDRVL